MATLKHISSKNSNYTAIEAYLVYQHDEFTGKQLLDEHGKPKLRESYLLDTLECGDFSFATACLLANRKYGKNTQRDDIKSHQYIISFDPRDAADNGLTMEKAQALGALVRLTIQTILFREWLVFPLDSFLPTKIIVTLPFEIVIFLKKNLL